MADWTLDKAARYRIDTALQAIDDIQSTLPKCVVCGQRTRTLDKHGTCTKTSWTHLEHRAGR